jgi:hypothetical protein
MIAEYSLGNWICKLKLNVTSTPYAPYACYLVVRGERGGLQHAVIQTEGGRPALDRAGCAVGRSSSPLRASVV